jgi:peptide/nickel transport system substrate-binding protein
VFCVAAVACGDDSGGSTTAEQPGGSTTTLAPVVGGTLRFAGGAEPTGFDPIKTSGGSITGGNEMMALYDTVMRYNPATGTFDPMTAESLTSNTDATVWTLKLRRNIVFSDGTPYDAAAVKVNIDRALTPESRLFAKALLQLVKDTTVVDPLTVRFTLSQGWGGFPFLFTTTAGAIVSPKAIAQLGDGLNSNPVNAGAGPFLLDSYKPKDSISFKRNPNYWGGQVYLDGFTIIWPGNDDIAYEGLLGGQTDVAFLRAPATTAKALASGLPTYTATQHAGLTLQPNFGRTTTNADGTTTVVNPVTKDLRVRQAIAAAIDPAQINARSFNGQGLASAAVIYKTSRLYSGLEGTPYDAERARRLVNEVKSSTSWDGTLNLVCDTNRQNMAQALQAMFDAVGFKTVVKSNIDTATLVNEVYVRAAYDVACFGIQVEDFAPFSSLQGNFSTAARNTRFGYSSPQMDEALNAIRQASNEGAMKAALAQAVKIIDADVATIPLAAVAETTVWRAKVHGIEPNRLSVMMLGKAWIEK